MKRILITAAAMALVSVGSIQLAHADAAETFAKKCANCHGKDGKGKTKMGEKLKMKGLAELKFTDDEAEKQIAEGVKDKDSGKERMPAFKDKLSGAEIKELVAYSKTLK